MKAKLLTLAMGTFMGACLSRIGFSSWDEVHAMFTFESLRPFLSFCAAVAMLYLLWRPFGSIAPEARHMGPRVIHRGTLAGGILFGVGWALSGACPSIALVQLGEGQLGAGWTLLGIVAGNWLYAALHTRFLRWDTGSCLDD